MSLGLSYLMEEIISNTLEVNGINTEIRHKILEEIQISCKETNYLHTSVADSNYYAAEERKENQRVINAEKEKDKLKQYYQDMIKDLEYTIRIKENIIQSLNAELRGD